MNLLPKSGQSNLDDLKANADIIEEVSALVTYIGIVQPNTTGDNTAKQAAAIWTIIKVTQSAADGVYPNVTTICYADGIAAFNKVWDDRATYNYIFKLI